MYVIHDQKWRFIMDPKDIYEKPEVDIVDFVLDDSIALSGQGTGALEWIWGE